MKRKVEEVSADVEPLPFTAEPEVPQDRSASSEPSGSTAKDKSTPSPAPPGSAPAAPSEPAAPSSSLSRAQRAQIERNRQRALLLREARLREHPARAAALEGGCGGRVLRVQGSRLVDSGGGFFIDEEADGGEKTAAAVPALKERPAPIHVTDRPDCEECAKPVASSFLIDSFDTSVCDACYKENKDKYALITRTEARNEYILKDVDLDRREPLLRYITRRNPHNPRWGEMRLYLRLHVEERALQVWGSEDELEKQHQLRDAKKEKIKTNKFNRRVKELRMAVRSSVYKKDLSGHEHTYGEETYKEDDDMYTRSCTECGHSQTYEKM